MPTKQIFFLAGLFFLIQFIIFSYLVHKDIFTAIDFNTTVRFQDNISRSFDNEFSFLSDVGKFEVTTLILLAIFVVTRRIMAGVAAFSFYVVFHLIELFGKFFVNHPPPPQFMLRTEQILNFPQFHVRTENSYPSGHSGRTIFISIILLILLWKTKRIPPFMKFVLAGLILGFDAAMLISRVTLGEHWATDVIAGSMLGAACGLFAGMFLVNNEHKNHVKGEKKSLFPKYRLVLKKVE
ncbi:MAG: phosphatase PAP2 family protein [Candidatus Levybacteria bacterium]|nr:phosphatase PAP2 family protein [Candidatus Levybacteria bacterium]